MNAPNLPTKLALTGMMSCAALLAPSGAAALSASNIIATYAGGGARGYSGDGGAALSAALNDPQYVALDASGNLYVSDNASHVIRKVSTAGIITTIAGTGAAGYNGDNIPATSAQLNNPAGIAFDANGDLYVADSANSRIRKITLTTGLIATVAGTGAIGCSNDTAVKAILAAPAALAFDTHGTLYFSEIVKPIVRKLSGGFVASFAGSCSTPVFQYPYGVTTDPAGNVYVAEAGTHPVVWKYDPNGNAAVFAGNFANGNTGDGSNASASGVSLTSPWGLARDATGDMFIGSGNVVRVVTPDGIIHTAVGNGTTGFTGDGELATSAGLDNSGGLAIDAVGRLFVADLSATPRVRIVGPAAPISVSTSGDAGGSDFIVSADGRISCPGAACGANYVSGMPVILDASPTSPDVLYEWSGGGCRRGGAACTLFPRTLAPTPVTAYFSPWYIKTLFGGTTGPALHSPFALAFDASGNLYFTEMATCTVSRRSAAGTIAVVAGNGVCGNLGDGMPATQAELNEPQGVAVDASGTLYIQDSGNNVIRKITGDGVLHTFAASGIDTGGNSPGLVADQSGDLFTLGPSNAIVRVTADGVAHPFASVPSEDASVLDGLSSGPTGGLVVYGGYYSGAPYYLPSFTFFGAHGSVVGSIQPGQPPYVAPAGMAVDRRGLLFSEGGCVLASGNLGGVNAVTNPYCGDGGYSGDGGPAAAATLNGPVGLTFDANGWLYVADTGNNAVRVLYPDAIFTGSFD